MSTSYAGLIGTFTDYMVLDDLGSYYDSKLRSRNLEGIGSSDKVHTAEYR